MIQSIKLRWRCLQEVWQRGYSWDYRWFRLKEAMSLRRARVYGVIYDASDSGPSSPPEIDMREFDTFSAAKRFFNETRRAESLVEILAVK